MNQAENNMQKYNRIKRFYKVIQNKKTKLNDFKNTSLWLKAVVGKIRVKCFISAKTPDFQEEMSITPRVRRTPGARPSLNFTTISLE